MRIFCLGGAGRICREAALDMLEDSDVERLTIGDHDENAAREVAQWLNDPRVDFSRIDVLDRTETVKRIQGYDLVMDGTTISLNDCSTACIAEAGANGINLNGFGEEDKYDEAFRKLGKILVPGFGMTPGITNMMAKHAADQMERVDSVRVSHGAFRPVAFSRSIAETTVYEYVPDLPGRVVFENGEFVQVPPFARPREIELPKPFGRHVQYIIPHAETKTLARYLSDKGVRLVEVRGTWPPKNMDLVRTLYDWGFLRNDRVKVGDAEFGIMDAIASHLIQSPEGKNTDLYGYAIHVEVTGTRNGMRSRHLLWSSHPSSDGSVQGWEGLRAYTRSVAIPMAAGARLIARGKAKGQGVVTPEFAFEPAEVFPDIESRGIFIHERLIALG